MKKLIGFNILVICLFMINHFSIAQAKINHIAVYVEDLKRSEVFYAQVFEFQALEEPFKIGRHAWFDIGGGIALHLIQAPWEPVTINKHNHICFSVPDMGAFIKKLENLGIDFEDFPGNKGEINIRPDGIQQIYIQDPDGYWIEINDEY